MSQMRLDGSATLSIEKEIAQTIDMSDAIKTFAEMKARKVNL